MCRKMRKPLLDLEVKRLTRAVLKGSYSYDTNSYSTCGTTITFPYTTPSGETLTKSDFDYFVKPKLTSSVGCCLTALGDIVCSTVSFIAWTCRTQQKSFNCDMPKYRRG